MEQKFIELCGIAWSKHSFVAGRFIILPFIMAVLQKLKKNLEGLWNYVHSIVYVGREDGISKKQGQEFE